jgi:hypothetical protein
MQGDFVIQLRPTSDLASGQFQGRVEHIDSGRSAQFHSVEELLAFLATYASAQPKNEITAV